MTARNPYLPEAPADGKHVFEENTPRCSLCGAYQGSPEAVSICKGEFDQSGKMRYWAEDKWAIERLQGDRPQAIIRYTTVRSRGGKMGGVRFTSSPRHYVLLECGCENEIVLSRQVSHDEFELNMKTIQLIENDKIESMACVDPDCLDKRMIAHAKLNEKNYTGEYVDELREKGIL